MAAVGKKIITIEKGNMSSKSIESQNIEFKSNWRDEAGGESCLNK